MTALGQISALFTNPALAAAGAAAVSIPIIIHLLTRLRRQQVQWAAMRFLHQAFRRHKQRLRLEQLLLLLVRCLLLALLGAALGGPLFGAWAHSTHGRLIVLVLDDSLSMQADDGGRSRFDRLRESAVSVVTELTPADRLAVWRGGAPAERLVAPGPVDVASARQLLESLKPRFSRSDVVGALEQVARDVNEEDRAVIFVLSDFAANTVDMQRPPPPVVVQLGKIAQLIVAPPAAEGYNEQIMHVSPRRGLVIADPAAPLTVPVELQLRRFATDGASGITDVRITLADQLTAEPLGSVSQEYRWTAGQSTVTLNVELPVEATDADWLQVSGSGKTLAIQATIAPSSITGVNDALEADNVRYATVELRRRLVVGIADDPLASRSADPTQRIGPRDWVRLALSPRGGGADTIELIDLDAAGLTTTMVASLDAVIVLRPDRLTDDGINALEALAERGGVVWITAPAAELPTTWAEPLSERLFPDWRVTLQPRHVGEGSEDGWLLGATPAPEPLNLLGADWQPLCRTVRVKRILEVTSREGAIGTPWMSLVDGTPLLLKQDVGEGSLLFLTTAIDTGWTNLPTRPLFVPLIHESLRSERGRSTDTEALCGRSSTLSSRWRTAHRLEREGGGAAMVVDQGFILPVRPGLYVAQPAIGGARIAVNVEGDAGDTRAIDGPRLMAWLGAKLLDRSAPASALSAQEDRSNIGWPLLWAVLGLLLFETALGRWFSHASRRSRRSALNPVTGRAAA